MNTFVTGTHDKKKYVDLIARQNTSSVRTGILLTERATMASNHGGVALEGTTAGALKDIEACTPVRSIPFSHTSAFPLAPTTTLFVNGPISPLPKKCCARLKSEGGLHCAHIDATHKPSAQCMMCSHCCMSCAWRRSGCVRLICYTHSDFTLIAESHFLTA